MTKSNSVSDNMMHISDNINNLTHDIANVIIGEIEGVEYTYIDVGQGETLILIPGTLGDQYLFDSIIDDLSKTMRVVVFNHLTGKSFTNNIKIYHQIFTEVLGLETFHMGGTSVGGWITQYYAMTYPNQIKSLIIGNSFAENELLRQQNLKLFNLTKWLPWFLLRFIFAKNIHKSLDRFDDEITEYFVESLKKMGKKQLRNRLSWSLALLPPLKLHSKLAKLIIYTEDDSVVSWESTERLIAKYPEAKVVALETGDHYPYRTNPNEYVKALVEFLSEQL